jgi:hypothetical protein
MAKKPVVPQEQIENAVLTLRGENLLLDTDLARFYGVSTKALNQAVVTICDLKDGTWPAVEPVTNCDRFPEAA